MEQKQKVLQGSEEEILDLCPVAAIDKEIDEADAKIVEILEKISDKVAVKPAPQVEGSDSAPSVVQATYSKLTKQQL